MKYLLLAAGDATVLEEEVNEHIQQGWIPIGGVSVAASNWVAMNHREGMEETYSEYIYAQALTQA